MIVKRLTSPKNVQFDIDKNIALMVVTTEHERVLDERTSYRACFSKVNLTRTLISIGIYCIQILSGNPLRGTSTYFLEQAGLSTTQSFNLAIGGEALAVVGNLFSVNQSPQPLNSVSFNPQANSRL
jgi:SP family general alpha glucoside:H+ symporter-like MFS transporter